MAMLEPKYLTGGTGGTFTETKVQVIPPQERKLEALKDLFGPEVVTKEIELHEIVTFFFGSNTVRDAGSPAQMAQLRSLFKVPKAVKEEDLKLHIGVFDTPSGSQLFQVSLSSKSDPTVRLGMARIQYGKLSEFVDAASDRAQFAKEKAFRYELGEGQALDPLLKNRHVSNEALIVVKEAFARALGVPADSLFVGMKGDQRSRVIYVTTADNTPVGWYTVNFTAKKGESIVFTR